MGAGAAKPLPSMAPPLPSRQSRLRHGSRSGASVAEKCGNWLSPPAWGVATLVRISRCRSSGAPRASRSAATGAFARERGTDRRRTAIPPPHRARNRHRCAWRDRASRRGSERRSGSGGRSGSEARSATCERVPRPRMGSRRPGQGCNRRDGGWRGKGRAARRHRPHVRTVKCCSRPQAANGRGDRRDRTQARADSSPSQHCSPAWGLAPDRPWRLDRGAIQPGMLRERLAWRPADRRWLIGPGETASAALAFRSTMHVTHPPGSFGLTTSPYRTSRRGRRHSSPIPTASMEPHGLGTLVSTALGRRSLMSMG